MNRSIVSQTDQATLDSLFVCRRIEGNILHPQRCQCKRFFVGVAIVRGLGNLLIVIINDWRAAIFWLRVSAVGYWQGIRADGLSPDSVGTGRVVQQIACLTTLQVEVIGIREYPVTAETITNGLAATDRLVCSQNQTVLDAIIIGHSTGNNSFGATSMAIVLENDALDTTVGNAARAIHSSSNGTYLSIVLIVADDDILHTEALHCAREVGEEAHLGSIRRDGTIFNGISATIIVSSKVCLASIQWGKSRILQLTQVDIGNLPDIYIGIMGRVDIILNHFQFISVSNLKRVLFSTQSHCLGIN